VIEIQKVKEESKYKALINIFSQNPYTLSSSITYSASTLSRFMSTSDFNPTNEIHSLLWKLLGKLESPSQVFLIADTTLLRKTGSRIEGVKKLYDPSQKRIILGHRTLVLVLCMNNFRIPVYVGFLHEIKPVDALIEVLCELLPFLKSLFPNLVFLCDAGLTSNKLLNFLISQNIDFVCAISQARVDTETGLKLSQLDLEKPERVVLKGVNKVVYAYRLGEGTNKERVVISNKRLSKKRFSVYYSKRWQIEVQIKQLKSLGLEDYMVRKLRAIRLWILTVWHVALIKLKCRVDGINFVRFLHSFVVPDIYLRMVEFIELFMSLIRRFIRFSSFPDDRLVYFLLQNLIVPYSAHAKL